MKKSIFIILLAFFQLAAGQDITQGLVAYFPFSGNANDASGNGHNGSTSNTSLTADISGIANSAYYFWGDSTSFITVPYQSDLQLSQFSLCAWMNADFNGAFNYQAIISRGLGNIADGESSNYLFEINATSLNTTIKYETVSENGIALGTPPGFFLQSGQWYFMTATYNEDSLKIFVDGNEVAGSQELSPPGSNSRELVIGSLQDQYYYTNGFKGTLDEIRIYNRALTNNEIQDLYIRGLPGIVRDSLALVALYNSTNGSAWNNNSNWLNGPINTWYGITVVDWPGEDRVWAINLPDNNLNGSIPADIGYMDILGEICLYDNANLTGTLPPEIGKLTNVWNLRIYNTGISGSIPPEIGHMSNLSYINLSDNQLTGTIPAEIGNLSNLGVLYMSTNQLTGTIPTTFNNLTNLMALSLFSNQLSGNLDVLWSLTNLEWLTLFSNNFSGSIPSTINNLSKLKGLSIGDNALTGNLPSTIGDLTRLRSIWLDTNHFNGSIPATIGNLDSLTDLHLYNNELSGSIPDEIGSMPWLKYLDLYDNQLDGSIPTTIGGLDSLRSMICSNNKLSGSIPDVFDNLTKLEIIHVEDNQLSGALPASLGKLSALRELLLARNQLAGDIPVQLYNATNLEWLALNQNQLTGSIPSAIGQLTKLRSLELFFNGFSGALPDEIASLSNLQVLDMSGNNFTALPTGIENLTALTLVRFADNNLSGEIPADIGNLVNLTSLWLNRNQLTGSIPASVGSLTQLDDLDLSGNQFTGTIPATVGNLVNLRYLSLRSNNTLTGPIPASIGNLVNLEGIDLAFNALSDTLPSELGNLRKLTYLTIDFNEFTGKIPPSLGNCDSLQVIYLGGNNLSGPIPKELGNLLKLDGLHLFDNNLSGTVPDELGNLVNLTHLGLGTNNLSGAIPATFTNLTKLTNVTLDHNQFTDLPDLSSLSALSEFLIYNNQFTFEDIIPNVNISGISYAPQDSVGVIERHTLNAGDNLTLTVSVGGANNQYQWYNGDEIISGETNTSYLITNADNNDNGTYFCSISNASASDLILWSRPKHVTVNGSAPVQPQLSSPANNATDVQTNPVLSWQRPTGAISFQCQVSRIINFSSTIIDQSGITETSVSLSDLDENTSYYWHVKAFNTFGESDWSTIRRFTTLEGPPPVPQAPALTSPANGATLVVTNPSLSWQTVNYAASYDLQIAQDDNFNSDLKNYSDLTGTSQQLSDLETGITYYWHVRAVNQSGNTWSDTWNFTTMQQPSVTLLNATDTSYFSITINGSVNPNGLETNVSMEYGLDNTYGTSISYNNNPITGDSPVNISFYLDDLDPGTTYHYKILAENTAGTDYTDDQTFLTPSYPQSVTAEHTFAFPSKSNPKDYAETDFRILGFPGASDLSIPDIFSGNAGEDYEVVWDKGNEGEKSDYLIKYSKDPGNPAFKFLTGRAFWVISKTNIEIKRTVDAASLNNDYKAEIKLHDGWNLITNPFETSIEWSWIQQENGITETIHSYPGGYQNPASFDPYVGYYYYNTGSQSLLRIPFRKAFTRKLPPNPMPPSWKLNITLIAGKITDADMTLGVSQNAETGPDRFDFHKPPHPGDISRIYFKRPEWDKKYQFFSRDIRPEFKELETWDFDLYEPNRQEAQIKISGIYSIPDDFEVFLVDMVHACYKDLREDSSYSFKAVTSQSGFKIIIGEETAVKEELRKILPSDYSLGNNFPNPFNPITTIPVSVPSDSYVIIKIYNILGQEVATLFKGTLTIGRHYLEWDGRNYASGIYIYRLLTKTGKSLAGKMALVK